MNKKNILVLISALVVFVLGYLIITSQNSNLIIEKLSSTEFVGDIYDHENSPSIILGTEDSKLLIYSPINRGIYSYDYANKESQVLKESTLNLDLNGVREGIGVVPTGNLINEGLIINDGIVNSSNVILSGLYMATVISTEEAKVNYISKAVLISFSETGEQGEVQFLDDLDFVYKDKQNEALVGIQIKDESYSFYEIEVDTLDLGEQQDSNTNSSCSLSGYPYISCFNDENIKVYKDNKGQKLIGEYQCPNSKTECTFIELLNKSSILLNGSLYFESDSNYQLIGEQDKDMDYSIFETPASYIKIEEDIYVVSSDELGLSIYAIHAE